ncbi:ATP-dependent protease La (LON) domain protein [Zostera marina]|uniref:ATP-dependent protease La (LON) domain protein n=1 Tax=Zostera marina TaxID=29655 RepID=A0A0K9PWW3_ZOSMR|nr:ATP-dependent protease La (LON) domain protein [Zostera marina]
MEIQVSHLLNSGLKINFHQSSPSLIFRCNASGFPVQRTSGIGKQSNKIRGYISHESFPFYSTKARGSRSLLKCLFSADKNQFKVPESNKLVELPLFPLPLVLFPGAILPLQIYEFKDRMMMQTILQTDLKFGIVYSDNMYGVVDVGCVAEVVKHERLKDDRFFLICKGQERFQVLNVVRTKPYIVGEVQWLEDRPSATILDDVEALALDVETQMKDVIRISKRMSGKPLKEVSDLRRNLFPTPFSFFVGSTFEGAPREQQALLELEDTATRLKREKETLRSTLNYLSAASAVKDVFQKQ